MAGFDALTGLPNRNQLGERLDDAWRREARTAAPMRSCASTSAGSRRSTRPSATISATWSSLVAERAHGLLPPEGFLAREGGDQFAILVEGRDPLATASVLAGTLVEVLTEPYLVGGHRGVIGVRVGIASSRPDDIDGAMVLRRADIALNRAGERDTPDIVFHEAAMDAAILAAGRWNSSSAMRCATASSRSSTSRRST